MGLEQKSRCICVGKTFDPENGSSLKQTANECQHLQSTVFLNDKGNAPAPLPSLRARRRRAKTTSRSISVEHFLSGLQMIQNIVLYSTAGDGTVCAIRDNFCTDSTARSTVVHRGQTVRWSRTVEHDLYSSWRTCICAMQHSAGGLRGYCKTASSSSGHYL